MPLKFLILILCLSSVIADESSGEFPIEVFGESNTLTEYPEYHEDALLSPDLSENSTVQLLDLLKPIGSGDEGGLVEPSGGTSGKSPDTATEIPKNANTAGAPENPRTTNLLDLFKMISGFLALLLIGCLLIVFVFYVDLVIFLTSQMKPILCLLVLLPSMFAFSNQKSIGDTPNSTSTYDPSMDTSTTSLFTRVFQMLIKTMLMVFGVAFSVILALLLIADSVLELIEKEKTRLLLNTSLFVVTLANKGSAVVYR
ncbi:hypothetical protein L5515_010360 [Caenorhabditis briggsae]|uniref:Transmembrane protein n=1 Tax=Caenorhabditis briggsae TaxID=6238 RepID=A0AAE9JFV0_CAEBR|nr:hypothetical protein L5515_010360 [Caenorhabditis briggsae]